MKSLKIITAISLLFALVALLSACGPGVSEQETAINLLTQKYVEGFEPVEGGEGEMMLFRPENNQNIVIEASVNEDGSEVTDNYSGKQVALRIAEKIEKNIPSKGECFVWCELEDEFLESSYSLMSAEEFAQKDSENHVNIDVFLTDKRDMNELQGMLTGLSPLLGTVNVYVTSGKTLGEIKEYLANAPRIDAGFDEKYGTFRVASEPYAFGSVSVGQQAPPETVPAEETTVPAE